MFKTALISIFLIFSLGIVLGAPRIASHATSNTAIAESKTKQVNSDGDDANTSEELLKLYPDPKELRFENLPFTKVVGLKIAAEELGLTLDEILFFTRIGLQAKKNKKEGKSSDQAVNKETICAEAKTIPTNPNKPSDEKMSETARTMQQIRQMCTLIELGENNLM